MQKTSDSVCKLLSRLAPSNMNDDSFQRLASVILRDDDDDDDVPSMNETFGADVFGPSSGALDDNADDLAGHDRGDWCQDDRQAAESYHGFAGGARSHQFHDEPQHDLGPEPQLRDPQNLEHSHSDLLVQSQWHPNPLCGQCTTSPPPQHGRRQQQQQQQQRSVAVSAQPAFSLSDSSSSNEVLIPLRQWIMQRQQKRNLIASLAEKRHAVIQETTVAFGIAKLLDHDASSWGEGSQEFNPQESATPPPPEGDDFHRTQHREQQQRQSLLQACNVDSFSVRVSPPPAGEGSGGTVEGVDMVHRSAPGGTTTVSLRIISPLFLSDEFFLFNEGGEGGCNGSAPTPSDSAELGRYLDVEITQSTTFPSGGGISNSATEGDGDGGSSANVAPVAGSADGSSSIPEHDVLCRSFGMLLYELYSGRPPFEATSAVGGVLQGNGGEDGEQIGGLLLDESGHSLSGDEPLRRKTDNQGVREGVLDGFSSLTFQDDTTETEEDQKIQRRRCRTSCSPPSSLPNYTPLKEMGLPSSISLLVENLLECGKGPESKKECAISSMRAACDDLHLLLHDPNRFLFDGVGTLDIQPVQEKLYGRDAERSLLTDVFCRVSLTGESECLFVDGYSGSGKTRLVSSILSYVDVSGGYIVRKKFDNRYQQSERSMSVIISAFNDLCPLIVSKKSQAELDCIVTQLTAVFGTHLLALTAVLPKVVLLSTQLRIASRSMGVQGAMTMPEINLSNVSVILQLFARVVSSAANPIMLFLDDMHWADSASLGALQHILSDIKGESCVYFIGSYRSNEVAEDHPLFLFCNTLKQCNIRVSAIHLDSMEIDEVNNIISDALGTLPRLCKPLSEVVLRKTKGNPLFVLEFLRSLVDRGLVTYSFKVRSWAWDTDVIATEDIDENVCALLSSKMTRMSASSQTALKVASCFGTSIGFAVVAALVSSSPQYSTLEEELERLVKDGFMDKDEIQCQFSFVHDKVREAAHDLIPESEACNLHHAIGMHLYYATLGQDNEDDIAFVVVDQINPVLVQQPDQRVAIAQLYCKAGWQAMSNSNSEAAFFYGQQALSLLPSCHWYTHYDLSLRILLVLGNASCINGRIEEAKSALNSVLTNAKELRDKLDAYYLLVSLYSSSHEATQAYNLCLEVLQQLGDPVPSYVQPGKLQLIGEKIQRNLSRLDENDIVTMSQMVLPDHYSLMRFYHQACNICFFSNNPMMKWFICRSLELTLQNGCCKYSASALMNYAMMLAGKLDVEEANRLGKIALKFLQRFDDHSDLIPHTYAVGLSLSADVQTALMNGYQYVVKAFASGTNLSTLKKECDYQLRLANAQSQRLALAYLTTIQTTIEMLLTNQASSATLIASGEDDPGKVAETRLHHLVMQSFWSGHYDRCLFYSQKYPTSEIGHLRTIMVMFYAALSTFHGKAGYKKSKKMIASAKNALDVIRGLSETGSWNYSNKVHLLEAEMHAANGKKDKAKVSFNAAISAARSSRFVHEQGLACEHAALFCLKHDDKEGAANMLKHARECYMRWGSMLKVESIEKRLEKLGHAPAMRLKELGHAPVKSLSDA